MKYPGYELVDGEWVKTSEVSGAEQPGRMPGAGGVAMEVVNAVNYEVLGLADKLTAGLFDLPELGAQYGIGSQSGYMDPGTGREAAQGGGKAIGKALGVAALAGRTLASAAGSAGELSEFTREKESGVAQPITNLANRLEKEGSPKVSNIANRVAEAISGVSNPARLDGPAMPGGPDTRGMEGTLYPSEYAALADSLFPGANIRMTPGQERMFSHTTTEQKMQAKEMTRLELIRSRSPEGIDLQRTYDYQREIPRALIARELDINPNKSFTDAILGQKMSELGDNFNSWADQVGTVNVGEDLLSELDNISGEYYGVGSGAVRTAAKNARQAVANGGGSLTGQEWQTLRKTFTDKIVGANRSKQQGMSDALGDMKNILEEALEGSAPQQMKDMIQDTRRQWALIENLQIPGVVSKLDGSINITSLYNNMYKGQRGKSMRRNRDGNDLARALETLNNLGTPALPSSGTGETVLGNVAGAAKTAGKVAKGLLPFP